MTLVQPIAPTIVPVAPSTMPARGTVKMKNADYVFRLELPQPRQRIIIIHNSQCETIKRQDKATVLPALPGNIRKKLCLEDNTERSESNPGRSLGIMTDV